MTESKGPVYEGRTVLEGPPVTVTAGDAVRRGWVGMKRRLMLEVPEERRGTYSVIVETLHLPEGTKILKVVQEAGGDFAIEVEHAGLPLAIPGREPLLCPIYGKRGDDLTFRSWGVMCVKVDGSGKVIE
jgi:hypothetical protein